MLLDVLVTDGRDRAKRRRTWLSARTAEGRWPGDTVPCVRRAAGIGYAVSAAAAALLLTVNGMFLSHDSYQYVTAARSVLDGNGFTVDGERMVAYPIGYPALLSIGGLFLDVFDAARVVNVSMFALAVYLAYRLTTRLGCSSPKAALAAALVATSPGLFLIAGSLLSEMTFSTLTLAVAVLLAEQKVGWRAVVIAGLVLGTLCVVRWAGVGVLAGACVAVLIADDSWVLRLRRSMVMGALGVAPMAMLAVSNRAASGTMWGERAPSGDSAVEVLHQFFRALGATLVRHASGAHLVLGVGAVVGLAYVVYRSVLVDDPRRRVVLIGVSYTVLILVTRIRSEFDDLGPRFLVPGLPLLAVAWVAIPGWSRVRSALIGAVIAVGAIVCARAILAGIVEGPQQREDLFGSAALLESVETSDVKTWDRQGLHGAPVFRRT